MTADATFAALHAAAKTICDATLFTVTVLDRKAGLARRAYTSHPVEYPTTGTKPIGSDPWSAQVIDRGEVFVANETAGFSPYFSDHELINALGCAAAVNIPVRDNATVVATVNILDVAGHFTPERVVALKAMVEAHQADLLTAFKSVPMTGTA